MFKVIKFFTDLQDNRHAYNVGDTFPREGLVVTPERLEELSSDRNKRKTPLIELIEEPLPFTEDDAVEAEEPITEEPVEEKPKPKRGRKKG